MQKVSIETQNDFRFVAAKLDELGYKIPLGVAMGCNIVGISEDLLDGKNAVDVIDKFGLGVSQSAFTDTFKRLTGVSVKDVSTDLFEDIMQAKLERAGMDGDIINSVLGALVNRQED